MTIRSAVVLKNGIIQNISSSDTLSPGTSITFPLGSTPTITQPDLVTNSGTGANLTIQAQNETGTTSTGGALILQSGSGTSAHGSISMKAGTQTIGAWTANSTNGFFTVDASKSGFFFSANGAGQQLSFNAIGIGGAVFMSASAIVIQDTGLVEAARITPASSGATNLSFAGTVTLPQIIHTQRSGTGANTGVTMKIMAQDGQNQSGVNNNNSGGDLWLAGGAVGTGGSGESPTFPGGVQFAGGSFKYARLDSTGLFVDKDFGDFEIGQVQKTGTGVNSGSQFLIVSQQGRNVSGGTNNNGGDIFISTGEAGTGGTGGRPGILNFYTGSGIVFQASNTTTTLSISGGTNIINGNGTVVNVGDAGDIVTLNIGASDTINFNMSGVTAMTADNNAVRFFGGAGDGGGAFVISIANANTVPTTNPVGGGILYAQGGVLKWRGSSGTVTSIAPA